MELIRKYLKKKKKKFKKKKKKYINLFLAFLFKVIKS